MGGRRAWGAELVHGEEGTRKPGELRQLQLHGREQAGARGEAGGAEWEPCRGSSEGILLPLAQGSPGADGPPGRDGAAGVKVSGGLYVQWGQGGHSVGPNRSAWGGRSGVRILSQFGRSVSPCLPGTFFSKPETSLLTG